MGYEFIPYQFGCYSLQLNQDINTLEQAGFVLGLFFTVAHSIDDFAVNSIIRIIFIHKTNQIIARHLSVFFRIFK
jgi:hypothetical protein